MKSVIPCRFTVSRPLPALLAAVAPFAPAIAQPSVATPTDVFPITELPVENTPTLEGPTDPLAEPAPEIVGEPDFFEALQNGKVKLNVRGRYEFVDQDNIENNAHSTTLRTRIGYLTGDFYGFQGYIEFEDVRAGNDGLFNAAGLNGVTNRPVVADVEGTELNELWLGYALPQDPDDPGFGFNGKVGRQSINLDDQRFVGTVGWRQDNQTFDSGTLTTNFGLEGFELFYGYVNQVNRIFAEANDFQSDTHLVNASYQIPKVGKLTGFAYLLDFDNAAVFSSQTYGVRLAGAVPLDESLKVTYQASVATQSDFGDNPSDYDALYVLGDIGVQLENVGTLGAGYELLGSDDGVSFQTPLATLHKFNGFADQFLVTPGDGLQDIYFYAKAGFLPKGTGALVAFHLFESDEGNTDFGTEIDAVLTQKLNDNLSVGGKLAYFMGDEGRPDVTRLTLDMTLSF